MLSATEKTSQYWDPLNHYYHHQFHQVHDLHRNPELQQPRLKGDRPTKVATHTHEEVAQLLKVVRRRGTTEATGKAKIIICEGDGAVSRVCADCNTSKTPLWRSGPAGPKSLCNACGIRYRKRRRRGLDFLNVGRSMLMKERKRKENVLNLLQWKLEEETEAAVLLMALSCGLFVHT